jgi:hypothetical protein
LSAAPQSRPAAPAAAAAPASPEPLSGLSMMRGGSGIRIADANASASNQAAPSSEDKKAQSRAEFTAQTRKNEGVVRAFAERMTRKYPAIRRYGRDWMSRPDLKKLNDDYMRNHDPVAFAVALTKAPSLGWLVRKYAASPAIKEFIVEGIKEAPEDLRAAGLDILSNDGVIKGLVTNVVGSIGLPPSLMAMIGGDGSKVDQKKLMTDLMNSPAAQSAAKQSQTR